MKDDKRTKYVQIKDGDPEQKPAPKARFAVAKHSRQVLAVIGTTFLTIFLILVITVCIVAVALTVYIMQFAENSLDVIDLNDVELDFSSFLVGYDADGNEVQLKQLSKDQNRVWVDFDDMPQHLIDAVVAVEDQRFFEHNGVDWTRTVSVTIDMFLSDGTEGGSTITQQLVRDITKDTKVNVGRKLREIFRALSLEQKYTKIDILESYLNRISFGGTSYGVGSAAKHYFNKDVSELTIAESAILAGIIRSPSNYNPYASLQQAKTRQKYALLSMYEQGLITIAEYEEALEEQVRFRIPVSGDYFGYIDERYNEWAGILSDTGDEDLYYENLTWEELDNNVPYKWNGGYEPTLSYHDEACINQVIQHLAEKHGISESSASDMLYNGGYTIYSNANLEMQTKIEALFEDPYIVLNENYVIPDASEDQMQAAFVLMDQRGNVLAIAGGIGEKQGDYGYDRATMSRRSIGSTIKPLTVYSLAIEMNALTYSTMTRNIAGKSPENQGDPEEEWMDWPRNYEETGIGDGMYYPTWYAVQKSLNTVAVRTLATVGIQNAFTHLRDRLGVTSLDAVNDMSWSPLALGALTEGMRLHELAAAYQVVGNGGLYYEPYFYEKVVDNTGKIVLEQDYVGVQAISSDTAWITNRMMKTVVTDVYGSGINAQIPGIEVIGKTGTANDMSNLLFAGLTPDYVGVVRIGYDVNKEIQKGTYRALAAIWKDVMVELIDTETERSFAADSTVITVNYCTETGLLATSKCPSTAVGYYRQSGIPGSCDDPTHDGSYWTTHGDPLDYRPLYK